MEIAPTTHSTAAKDHLVRCISCGVANGTLAADFRCLHCGDLLAVDFPKWWEGLMPDPARLKALWRERRTSNQPLDSSGVWRFREMLPALDDWASLITLREGNTPLYDLPRCARSAGVEHLQAKHQGMNPTGSFKDTGMTVATSFARQNKFRWVACASTGNTSASMAAYAARGGMRSLVIIPEGKIAWGKLSQSLDYGAVTCQLRTDFDGCVRVLNDIIRRYPIYLLNSVNPYRLEGQKTAAIELLEQLDWQVPDHVIIPGGNLGNNSALGKAFLEMKRLGLADSAPKISVIQAEGANPLYRTVHEKRGRELVPVQAETLATAIRIGNPASWKKSLRVIEATGGCVEQVNEAEIAIAKAEIGADSVGCEPASAVTLAGLKKLVKSGFVQPSESIVLIFTGHVLKDPEYTIQFHRGDLSVPRMA
ncbi:MAG TPA: threonine synthase, partial [Terriglobales bacterium]